MWPPEHSLITGASSGIGAAMAQKLAQPGSRLTLLGRSAQRLAEIERRCRDAGSEVTSHAVDTRDQAAMQAAIDSAWQHSPLDLIIANAGVSGGDGVGPHDLIDINVHGVINTVEPIIPLMRERGQGRIAIMSSLAGFKAMPNAPLYCASKAAVRAYGEALAAKLVNDGITVTVLCPGFIKTPLTDKNPFPMPLIMDADKAAGRLLKGIERGQTRVAFPKRLYWTVRMLELLPANLARALLARTAGRQAGKE